MTSRPSVSDPIWALIDASVNGTISETEYQQLVSRLETDPAARWLYMDYCELHAGLSFVVWSEDATREALTRIKQAELSESDKTGYDLPGVQSSPVASLLQESTTPGWFALPSSSMVAALLGVVVTTVLFAAGLGIWSMSQGPTRFRAHSTQSNGRTSSSPLQHASAQVLVATLTGKVDCRWAPGTTAPTYGEQLFEGRVLELESGLAQLTFESGAKLILQGPATFQAVSTMEGLLEVGKVSAVVPRPAQGFTVRTPSAEVVDLGTEFGVEVDRSGRTEVHVFNGEVVSWKLDEQGRAVGGNMHLTEREFLSIGQDGIVTGQGGANSGKFVREVVPRLSSEELPPLSVKDDLALWLAADSLVRTDDQNRVIAWRDILAGDNQSEEDAWQHKEENRPLLVEGAMGGKPAVRFDGERTFLVTTPLTTTDNQTVLIVFSQAPGALDRSEGGQLINYNGPPHRYIIKWGAAGVLQIGDMDLTAPEDPGVGFFRGFAYAGRKSNRDVNVGKVMSRQRLETGHPVICAFVYDLDRHRSEMFLNGLSQGVANAPIPTAVTSRKVIGRHGAQEFYFLGDISEVLIYNSALPSKEINEIHQYLGKKYEIEVVSTGGSETEPVERPVD